MSKSPSYFFESIILHNNFKEAISAGCVWRLPGQFWWMIDRKQNSSPPGMRLRLCGERLGWKGWVTIQLQLGWVELLSRAQYCPMGILALGPRRTHSQTFRDLGNVWVHWVTLFLCSRHGGMWECGRSQRQHPCSLSHCTKDLSYSPCRITLTLHTSRPLAKYWITSNYSKALAFVSTALSPWKEPGTQGYFLPWII